MSLNEEKSTPLLTSQGLKNLSQTYESLPNRHLLKCQYGKLLLLNEEEAAKAYNKAAKKLYGEFAYVNFI